MSGSKKTSVTEPRAVRSASSARYVMPAAGEWVVRATSGGRAASVHRTQAEAIKAAREAISAKGGELVIQGTNGRTRTSVTVGCDPFQKISAVEGISPTEAARSRAKAFAKTKMTSEERLKAIIEAYRPDKG